MLKPIDQADCREGQSCPTCGSKLKAKREPKQRTPEEMAKLAKLTAATRDRNRAAGLCTECGHERKPGSEYCIKHLQAGKARADAARERRKAAGLTVRGTPPKRQLRAA